jgi:hypothetical protein
MADGMDDSEAEPAAKNEAEEQSGKTMAEAISKEDSENGSWQTLM